MVKEAGTSLWGHPGRVGETGYRNGNEAVGVYRDKKLRLERGDVKLLHEQ